MITLTPIQRAIYQDWLNARGTQVPPHIVLATQMKLAIIDVHTDQRARLDAYTQQVFDAAKKQAELTVMHLATILGPD